MPFTMQEAREWATYLHEAEAKATDLEALKIIEDIRESIDRDAEAAGWHSEWESMTAADADVQADDAADPLANAQDEARAVLEEMREAALELPELTSDILHRASVLDFVKIQSKLDDELKGYGQMNWMTEDEFEDYERMSSMVTIPELILWIIGEIEAFVVGEDRGCGYCGVYVEDWHYYPRRFVDRCLTRLEAERIAEFFSGFGICAEVKKKSEDSNWYTVWISW